MNRANVVLKNSNSALNKLITLISVNDVPRIHTFFKSCLNRGIGINSIIENFQEALNKVSKTKSYTQKELDIGLLCLRIGGPRLTSILNRVGFIPSESTIHRAFKINNCRIFFSLDYSINYSLEFNLDRILKLKGDGLYSLKLDELHIESRIRWSSSTNEFIGTCFNHKDKISSYKFTSFLSLEAMH